MKHGTRGSYVSGCRCFKCRLASAEYEYGRINGTNEKKMTGERQTDKARKRLELLLENGWSQRELCRYTGIPRRSLYTLSSGNQTHRRETKGGKIMKTRSMSIANYKALMNCPLKPDFTAKKARTLVDSEPVLNFLEWCRENGVSMAEVSRQSGVSYQSISTFWCRKPERMTARNFARIMNYAGRLIGVKQSEAIDRKFYEMQREAAEQVDREILSGI